MWRIISFHDLKATPDYRDLQAKARRAKSLGADIFKVATRTDTPAQLARFESYGHFEVIGSRTGKRYRIRHNRIANIDQLDERGAQVAIWCFGPEGNLPRGDVMLAQKIALENDEDAALAIAIRHS